MNLFILLLIMNYVLLIGLAFVICTPIIKAWDCSSHLIIMQIALKELGDEEKGKITRLLDGMTSKDAKFSMLEAACFHEDMTASGFTAFELWKSYETPFYDGISEHEAHFTKPLMDSYFAIV